MSQPKWVHTVTVYLDKESLGPEDLHHENDVNDDLHDVGVLTRLPVWPKLVTLESVDVSQCNCTVDQKYDGLCDVRLLECQFYHSQFSAGDGGVITSYTDRSVGVFIALPGHTGDHWG